MRRCIIPVVPVNLLHSAALRTCQRRANQGRDEISKETNSVFGSAGGGSNGFAAVPACNNNKKIIIYSMISRGSRVFPGTRVQCSTLGKKKIVMCGFIAVVMVVVVVVAAT